MEDNKVVAPSEEEEEEEEEDQEREEHACKDKFDGKAHRERAPSMNTRRTTSSSVSVSRAATAGEPVVVKEGWLTKKGHVRKNWKRRWFVLRKDTEELLYYKSSKVKPTTTPQGVIDLGCYLCDLCNRPKCFQMVSKGKVFVIEADSVEERNDWMKAISTVGEKVEAIPGRDKPKPNKAQKDKPGKGDRRLSFLTKQGKIKRNLSLSNLALTEVPAKTWTLSELRKLDISCNEIATFPLELCSMNKLLSLDFSTNLLKDIPPEIGKMTALTELDLEENKIEHIPEEIGRLTRLKKLVLGNGEDWFNVMKVYHNKLTELPKNFVNLTSLTSLDVTYNHLSEIPSVFFANCRELRFLDVSGNQLTRLPSEIGCLTKLDRLYASSNKLEAIPYTIGKLTNLQVLCMQNNKISKIPYQVGLLSKLETLFLEDNPIKDPPRSVFKRGLEDLLDYFVDLIRGEERTFRARVLVVGESKTGRSSFVKVLTALPKKKIAMPGGPSQEDANKSLVITDWLPKVKHPLLPSTSAVTFHIWDFNCPCKVPVDADKGEAQGEDASSSTTAIDSTLFFSEECVYVLVLSCKVQGHVEKDLSKVVRSWRLRSWLKRIEQVRRFEETSVSTIIVVTHADDDIVSQGEKKKLFGALERKYKKHPGVNLVSVNFINNNLKKDNGKLMAKIQKEIVDSSLRFAGKHGMGKLFPRGVLQLEKILQERKAELNSAPAITMAEFKQLCKLCLLEKPEDVLMALRVLRNWGSLLYFEEKPITLKHVLQRDKADEEQTNDPLADSQQLVLSPEWFVEKLVKGEVRL